MSKQSQMVYWNFSSRSRHRLSVKTASIEKRRQEEEQRKKEEEEKKREEERRKESRDGKKKTTKAKTKKPHAGELASLKTFLLLLNPIAAKFVRPDSSLRFGYS